LAESITSSHLVEGGFLKLTAAVFCLVLPLIFGACQSSMKKVAVNPDYIPREVLYGHPDVASLALSPDGKYVAYLAEHKGVLNIWVQDFGKPESARPVTADTQRGIFGFDWTYTSGTLVFNQDKAGDENFGLYTLDITTGNQTEIAAPGKDRSHITSLSHLRPTEAVLMTNRRDPKYFDYKILNLVTKEQTDLFTNTENFAGILFDKEFKPVYARKTNQDGSATIYLWNAATRRFQKKSVIPFEDNMSTGASATTLKGDKIYMLDSRGQDKAALKLWDPKTNQSKLLAQNPKADIIDMRQDPKDGRLLWATSHYLKRHYEFFDAEVEKHFKKLEQKLKTDVTITSMSLDGTHWVILASDPQTPSAYYYYDLKSESLSEPILVRRALAAYAERLSPMEAVEIKSRDGLGLVSYLTKPKNPVGKTLVLLVHGGPWHRDYYGYNGAHQWLADRGYHVLSVNFRSSTGLGKKFLNAGDHEWGRKSHDDLIDAVNWAIEKGYADKDKVAIMGGSYGGYAALAGVTFTPDVFAAAVDIVGPSNLETLLETVPPYWESFRANLHRRVGDPKTAAGRKLLKERSPLNYVDRIKKPLLILQGSNDPRVKKAESDQIFNAMLAKKIPVEYVLFPDEGHGFAKAQNNLGANAIIESFLQKHLGGRLEPIDTHVKGSTAEFVTTAQ